MALPKVSLKTTYTQERGPAIPSFDAYAERLSREFRELIDSEPPESKVQAFLEENPCMVPGAKTPINHPGHGPIHGVLIARPPLHGFNGRIPDFMWLSAHSGAWYPAMVEIERPNKRVFRANGEPTAEFGQARNQLAQWQTWLDEPANQIKFMLEYGISSYHQTYCTMERHFILVYGRRAEFSDDPPKSKSRQRLVNGPGEELMSFDRLAPDHDSRNEVCGKAIGSGKFRVIHVPETFSLHPATAQYLPNLIGLEDAIDRNPRIPRDRAAFLRKRIPEWIAWYRANRSDGMFMDGKQFWE